MDSSHPPTVHRINFLQAHIKQVKERGFSLSDFEKIENELEEFYSKAQKELVESYKSALFESYY